ncbi:MAG TPA: hypothetical protein VK604_01385 [Bryobacteraceae bacterium]|nr:hypothetical protein [Bryobacteraceae bacterium]
MEIPLTAEQFKTLSERAGIAPGETSGIVEKSGVQAHWTYDGRTLTAAILKKPMLVPLRLIESRFRKWAGL